MFHWKCQQLRSYDKNNENPVALGMAQELGRQIRGEKDWRVAQANSPSTPGSGIRAPNGLSVSYFAYIFSYSDI